ncbi:MAG: DUF2474 domain-containing protein [Pseudomonadota bacterium]
MEHSESQRNDSWLRRVGWMVAIWTLSVAAFGAVSMVIRSILH